MWRCAECGEEHAEVFNSCWKCGTDRPGPEGGPYRAAAEPTASEEEGADAETETVATLAELEELFRERFRCAKCENEQALIKRIATTGTGVSKLLNLQHNTFVAVTCTYCSYTEFYNPEVLEGKRVLGSVIDVLFG